MLSLRMALTALLLRLAMASPVPTPSTAPPATNSNKITLLPARAPDVNGKSITNLLGTNDFIVHYDSDPNPNTDSVISTMSASDAPYPIVQLEDTDFVQSMQCDNNAASIVFNDRTAYQAAMADWSQHNQFVLFSHHPNCGSGYARGTRDYALVNSVKSDNTSMTIEATMEFVDYATAVGGDTQVHVSLGHYQAPNSKRKRLSKSSEMKWNEYPTNTLSTQQFGAGYQLLQSSELDVICAGCGTAGDLTFTGDVDFSFFHGIKKVDATITGNMQATLALGLVARDLQGKIPIGSIQLASIGLPGFEIPEVATFGPQIDLSAAANVQLDATGNMQLGATLSWSSINIALGLDNDNSQQASGLLPTADSNFKASGDISATLDLSLPVSVGIGIDILDGKWNKQLAIVDTPTFALTGQDGTSGSSSCSGVGLSGALENSVGANIVGVTTVGLASTTIPLFSTCLGSASTSSTAASLTSSGAASLTSSSVASLTSSSAASLISSSAASSTSPSVASLTSASVASLTSAGTSATSPTTATTSVASSTTTCTSTETSLSTTALITSVMATASA